MLDELRSKDWVPRSVRENVTKLERAMKSLRSKGIDNPSDKALASELAIPVGELEAFLSKANPIALYSLDEVIDQNEDNGTTLIETISSQDEDQLDRLINSERKKQLADAISELPEKEQLILSLYYHEELNLKEIAEVMDLTESRISQMRTKILAKLKIKLTEQDDNTNMK